MTIDDIKAALATLSREDYTPEEYAILHAEGAL